MFFILEVINISWYLVQYNPLIGKIGRYIAFTPSNYNEDKINKFYEEVNASDYYHETVVISIYAKSTYDVENEIFRLMAILYNKERSKRNICTEDPLRPDDLGWINLKDLEEG